MSHDERHFKAFLFGRSTLSLEPWKPRNRKMRELRFRCPLCRRYLKGAGPFTTHLRGHGLAQEEVKKLRKEQI